MNLDFEVKQADPPDVQLERFLRAEIVSGSIAPGTRLPPTRELAQRWRVNNNTISRALAPLAAEGLVVRSRKRGTFVRAATDKALVGVIVGVDLTEESAHFYRAMLNAFRAELEDRDSLCRGFDGLFPKGKTNEALNPQAHRHLMDDLRHHRFTGFIEFTIGDEDIPGWPRPSTTPRVCFDSSRADTDANFDVAGFIRESIAFLARRGRRRICFLRAVGDTPPPYGFRTRQQQLDCAMDAVRELGLPPLRFADAEVIQDVQGPMYEQRVFAKAEATIRDWARLPAAERPDALLVSDDIAMRAVALALIKAGVRVPDDVVVVSQASEGIALHYGLPVVRYEFSPRAMARALTDLLWKRIRGEPDPKLPILIGGRLREEGA